MTVVEPEPEAAAAVAEALEAVGIFAVVLEQLNLLLEADEVVEARVLRRGVERGREVEQAGEVERAREALLWTWAVGRVGALDDAWGAHEEARAWIELGGGDPPEERKTHAALLRDLLVAINAEYRRKHGTPPPLPSTAGARREREEEVRGLEREVRDVEMIAV